MRNGCSTERAVIWIIVQKVNKERFECPKIALKSPKNVETRYLGYEDAMGKPLPPSQATSVHDVDEPQPYIADGITIYGPTA